MPGAALIRTPWGIVRFLQEFWLSFIKSISFCKKNEIEAIVVFGGFTSLGPAMAARWLGIPVFYSRGQSGGGKGGAFYCKVFKRDFTCRTECELTVYLPRLCANVGYPLRHDFRRVPRERARKRLGFSNSERLLVVLGGSQGASSLNQWLKNNLSQIADAGISGIASPD